MQVAPSSDDYNYDGFNAEWSPDDLEIIDAVVSDAYTMQSPPINHDNKEETLSAAEAELKVANGGPQLKIEYERVGTDATSPAFKAVDSLDTLLHIASQEPTPTSPYILFRSRRNILSVTDLVGPQWCELQYDYGLRGMRHLPVAARPELFRSGSGKEIKVEKKVALVNEKIIERGRSVHKVLEKEIRLEEVRVDITSDEERWALRLVNMISCLDCLMDIGKAREMPIFGLVGNQIVTGIIDEVDRKPADPPELPKTPKKSKKLNGLGKAAADASPSKQTALTAFFPVSPAKASDDLASSSTLPVPTAQQPKFTLHLSDTKTRRASGLPSDEDSISGRLQLMLYSRFMTTLLSSPSDLEVLFILAEVDPTCLFSEVFCAQIAPLLGFGASASTLNELVVIWTARVADLGVTGVHPTLTLVYRAQEDRGKGRGKRKRAETSVEDEALKRAIRASLEDALKDVKQDEDEQTVDQIAAVISLGVGDALESAPTGGATEAKPPIATESVAQDADLVWTVDPEKVVQETATSGENVESASEATSPSSSTSNIIGTKSFPMDDAFLNEQLARSLSYWYGARSPDGVPVDLSRRCFTCEYCEGCEWREKKAAEAVEKFRARRDGKENVSTVSIS